MLSTVPHVLLTLPWEVYINDLMILSHPSELET
jgi:hypothetical protein